MGWSGRSCQHVNKLCESHCIAVIFLCTWNCWCGRVLIHGCAAIKNKCAPIWKSGEKMVICEFKLSCQLFHWWLLLLLSATSFSINFITHCHFCWTKITKQQLLYMIEEKQLEVEGEAMVCLCSLSGGKKSLNHCVNTSYVLVQLMLDLNLKFVDLPSP